MCVCRKNLLIDSHRFVWFCWLVGREDRKRLGIYSYIAELASNWLIWWEENLGINLDFFVYGNYLDDSVLGVWCCKLRCDPCIRMSVCVKSGWCGIFVFIVCVDIWRYFLISSSIDALHQEYHRLEYKSLVVDWAQTERFWLISKMWPDYDYICIN